MSTQTESYTPTPDEMPHPFMADNKQHNPFRRGDEYYYPAGLDGPLVSFTSHWRTVVALPAKLKQWYDSKNFEDGLNALEQLARDMTRFQDARELNTNDLLRQMEQEGYKDDGTRESVDNGGRTRCPKPYYCLDQYQIGYPILVDTAFSLNNKWKPKFKEAQASDDPDLKVTYSIKRSKLFSALKKLKGEDLSHLIEDGQVSLTGTEVTTGPCSLNAITSYSADAASTLGLSLDVLKLTKFNTE